MSKKSRTFTLKQLLVFSLHIVDSVDYIHKIGIIHGDLACRNFLVSTSHDTSVVKLSDFGKSTDDTFEYYKNELMNKFKIKANSPDQGMLPTDRMDMTLFDFRYDKNQHGYYLNRLNEFSNTSDLWSLSIVMWEVFSLGQRPYPKGLDLNINHLYNDVAIMKEQGYRMSLIEDLPLCLTFLIYQFQILNPKLRPNINQMKQALENFLYRAKEYNLNLNQVMKGQLRTNDTSGSVLNNLTKLKVTNGSSLGYTREELIQEKLSSDTTCVRKDFQPPFFGSLHSDLESKTETNLQLNFYVFQNIKEDAQSLHAREESADTVSRISLDSESTSGLARINEDLRDLRNLQHRNVGISNPRAATLRNLPSSRTRASSYNNTVASSGTKYAENQPIIERSFSQHGLRSDPAKTIQYLFFSKTTKSKPLKFSEINFGVDSEIEQFTIHFSELNQIKEFFKSNYAERKYPHIIKKLYLNGNQLKILTPENIFHRHLEKLQSLYCISS